MKEKKYFLNLTNGIEALKFFKIPYNEINFIRIQSSHLESGAFEKILLTLDSNFLMWLAMGFECIVYDFGAKSEKTKALYYGLEWIRYFINIRWFDRIEIPMIGENNVSKQFFQHYKTVSKKTKRHIDYYKKFLMTDNIYIISISSTTFNDNQPNYFYEILKNYFETTTDNF